MSDYTEMLLRHLDAGAMPPTRKQSVRTRTLLVRALQALSDAAREAFPPALGVRHALPDNCFLSFSICQLMRCLAPFLLDKGTSPQSLLAQYAEVDAQLFGDDDAAGGGAPLQSHMAVLDHAGKALFLNLYIQNRIPVDLVLSREAVFDDLLETFRDDSGDNGRPLQRPSVLSLRAYFKSEFGKKRVNGQQVEEGEGLGPRKEFYALASVHLQSMWKGRTKLEGCVAAAKGSTQVTGDAGSRFLRDVQKGMRISIGIGQDDKPQNEAGVVAEVTSDTELTVERRFQSQHTAETAWVMRHADPLFVHAKGQETFW